MNLPLIDDQAELDKIYAEIASRTEAAHAEKPIWPCRKGCDLCCRRLANVPALTAAEWTRLAEGIAQLAEEVQHEIEAKILALGEGERPFIVCPLLDEASGACRVYHHRPAACRMYGFYVSRYNNQWCEQIDALFEAGQLDGVTLGNYAAMKRQLHRQFGETKTLVEWTKSRPLQQQAQPSSANRPRC